MLHIYVTCGVWSLGVNKEWRFVFDEEKRGRLLMLESTTTLDELKTMVSEDYGVDQSTVDLEFSYLPNDLISTLGSPPVNITNDRQVKYFVGYARKNSSIRLCVTFTTTLDNQHNGVNINLYKEPSVSSNGEEDLACLIFLLCNFCDHPL